MKVTIYELLGMVKDEPDRSIYVKYFDRVNKKEDVMWACKENIIYKLEQLIIELNDEVEIIEEPQPTKEEKKKFTKEDFINERMGIDKITRKEFDEMYEVKECNCGMPYCKGFIAVDKEEPQEHKIPEKLDIVLLDQSDNWTRKYNKNLKDFESAHIELNPYVIDVIRQNSLEFQSKINEILDYLEVNNGIMD